MEPLSITSVTLASILASFPVSGEPVSQSVITTHISPAIAGQWEIDLESINARVEQSDSSAAVKPPTPESTDNILIQSERSVITPSPTTLPIDNTIPKPTVASFKSATSQCRELYNFGEDNEMRTVSGEEWTYGRYIVSHVEEGLPIIAINTVYDNNEMDCSGSQVDQTGETLIAFLNHKGNQMQWCTDSEGTECFMNFSKVLP